MKPSNVKLPLPRRPSYAPVPPSPAQGPWSMNSGEWTWGWNWIVNVPLASSQLKCWRPVNAEATGPPPPAIGSLTKVPLEQSGEVAVNVPCGTGPLKSARTVIVTGTGGVAPAAVGSATVARAASNEAILRMVLLPSCSFSRARSGAVGAKEPLPDPQRDAKGC